MLNKPSGLFKKYILKLWMMHGEKNKQQNHFFEKWNVQPATAGGRLEGTSAEGIQITEPREKNSSLHAAKELLD